MRVGEVLKEAAKVAAVEVAANKEGNAGEAETVGAETTAEVRVAGQGAAAMVEETTEVEKRGEGV